jgi:hypothetical protein
VAGYNGWTGEEKLQSFGMHLEGIARRWHLSLNPAPENFADLQARFFLPSSLQIMTWMWKPSCEIESKEKTNPS